MAFVHSSVFYFSLKWIKSHTPFNTPKYSLVFLTPIHKCSKIGMYFEITDNATTVNSEH